MLINAILQWLHEGRTLAGQLVATGADRTAWVGIYPLNLERPETASILRREGLAILPGTEVNLYRIRLFEVADALRETCFGETEMDNKRDLSSWETNPSLRNSRSLRSHLSRSTLQVGSTTRCKHGDGNDHCADWQLLPQRKSERSTRALLRWLNQRKFERNP